MVKEEFTALFKGYKIPNILKNLLDFQTSDSIPSYYSNALYLLTEGDNLIEEVSDNPEFTNAFIPFAEADSAGSIYAFWINDTTNVKVEDLPIVVFGGEEGIHLVAQNLNQLLQIAAYDVEPSIFEEELVFSDKELLIEDDEFVATEFNKEYLDWLRSEAKLKPIVNVEDIDAVIEGVNNEYGIEFLSFLDKM
ncbi:cell wall assembly protein [Myroides pelagicus]|uniref:Cell wall assembly protein n=1 Tax=Myroides pelagicus TaxID=270914 RepID=A0A7K1GRS9_9FLAO|nr:cell wall assembly protein [Myroides pelagicus]MEC4115281.1 cell wall assembly protein [Myroides pelagicus]MTH31069.1 cell wall assembly protein [Myroides pelagicus]